MSIPPNEPAAASAPGSRRPGRRAWHGNPPQVEAARQRLLRATARCVAREGIAETSVAAIAAEAGVSRQTVYRYFRGRDELVLGSIRAASEGLREEIERRISGLRDPAAMIVETLLVGLAGVREDPVLRAIADSSRLDGPVVGRITGPAGLAWVRETLAAAIAAAGWSPAEADEGLEMLLRVFLSLILSPAPERSPDELRAFLHRRLVPSLGLAPAET